MGATTGVKRRNGIGNIYGGFEFKVLTANFMGVRETSGLVTGSMLVLARDVRRMS